MSDKAIRVGETLTALDMIEGDVVRPHGWGMGGPWNTMVVKKIERIGALRHVTFFRPFVHQAEYTYTAGVPCYIGIEEFTAITPYDMDDPARYELMEQNPKR